MKPTQVRLPKVVRDRITDLVGNKGMAGFIRQAVEEKLARDDAPPERSHPSPKASDT